jgi:Ca2+-binding EF-hand superfamily protein
MSSRRRSLILLAFDKLDADGSGQVTIEDLAMTYDTSKHPEVISGALSNEDALKEFLSQWDTIEQDGIVTKDEFLEYYKDVSASIDTDDYFELMIRNAWKLAGGEGVSAMTNYDTRMPPKGVVTEAGKYFANGGQSLATDQ